VTAGSNDEEGRIVSLRGFSTISFWADDVPAAVAWYTEFLGVDAYFTRPGPDGRLAYAEFRIGDSEDELGIINSNYRPPIAATAGVRYNPHHLEALATTKPA
jgi:catechol 2,3-dioxygenase-like lactoylglutathione lyase family enzyme